MGTLKEFLSKSTPHNLNNGHPPTNPNERYDWESKLLYSVNGKLKDDCVLLDYGCGANGTLKTSLFNRYPNSKYYGLDIRKFTDPEGDKINLGHINDLEKTLSNVDCVVAGSIFSHLSWGGIESVLDKLKPLFDKGGEFGFTSIISDKYELLYPNWYGVNSDTYGMSIITEKQYHDYCNKNDLIFEKLPFSYPLKDNPYEKQDYCNIKKIG